LLLKFQTRLIYINAVMTGVPRDDIVISKKLVTSKMGYFFPDIRDRLMKLSVLKLGNKVIKNAEVPIKKVKTSVYKFLKKKHSI
jgi:hypothetical protein